MDTNNNMPTHGFSLIDLIMTMAAESSDQVSRQNLDKQAQDAVENQIITFPPFQAPDLKDMSYDEYKGYVNNILEDAADDGYDCGGDYYDAFDDGTEDDIDDIDDDVVFMDDTPTVNVYIENLTINIG